MSEAEHTVEVSPDTTSGIDQHHDHKLSPAGVRIMDMLFHLDDRHGIKVRDWRIERGHWQVRTAAGWQRLTDVLNPPVPLAGQVIC